MVSNWLAGVVRGNYELESVEVTSSVAVKCSEPA
jgi:hypothetical protein